MASAEPGIPEIAELKKRFEKRIRARSFDQITDLAHDPGYLFVSNVRSFSRVGELGTCIGASGVPIYALTHTLYTKVLRFAVAG